MKVITNESLQALEVYLNTPLGIKCYYFQPHDVKTVPDSYISNQVLKLQKRRILKVNNYYA